MKKFFLVAFVVSGLAFVPVQRSEAQTENAIPGIGTGPFVSGISGRKFQKSSRMKVAEHFAFISWLCERAFRSRVNPTERGSGRSLRGPNELSAGVILPVTDEQCQYCFC